MEELVKRIFGCVQSRRFDLVSEAVLQSQIEQALEEDGIEFKRELNINRRDRPDFLCGNVAIEVKIKGQRKAIYKQCERYCENADALILITNRSMGLPETINGKPCYMINLGRSWL